MFGRKKADKPVAFALGKIAGHPEFLAAPDDLATSIDRWLDSGWQAAHSVHGEGWGPAFADGTTYGFVWSHGSKAREVTYGVLAPSVDSIGRHYPVVVGTRMAIATLGKRGPSFLPMAASAFLDDAHTLIVESRACALPVPDLLQRLVDLAGPSQDDLEEAEEAYAAWSTETSVETGWSTIFSSDPLASAERTVAWLGELLGPWVGCEWPATSLVLRLPMGEAGARAVAIWLEVVRAILGWQKTVPTAFWGGDGSSLLLAVAPPTPALLGELWWPGTGDDGVIDVERAAATHEGSEARCSIEARRASTMAEFLTTLAVQR